MTRVVHMLDVRRSGQRSARGTVAYFDVMLFGQLNIFGCCLRQRDDGSLYFLEPGFSEARRGGKPHPLRIHCAKLRREIVRAASVALATAPEACPP